MKMLDLLPIGDIDARLLQDLAPALADSFRVPCRIRGRRGSIRSSPFIPSADSTTPPKSCRRCSATPITEHGECWV